MKNSRLAALAVALSATFTAPTLAANLLAIDYNYTGDSSPTQTGFSPFALGLTNGFDVTNTYGSLTVETEADAGPLSGAFDRGTFVSPLPDLYRDYAFNNDGGLTTTISGLISGQSYGLTLYSFDNSTSDTATITTTFTPISGTLGSAATVVFTDGATPTTPLQYAATTVWVANGSGEIVFSVLGSGTGVSSSPIPTRTNGFELTVATPEPSSLVLAAVGAVGCVALAHRRRRRFSAMWGVV